MGDFAVTAFSIRTFSIDIRRSEIPAADWPRGRSSEFVIRR
jgi:hypothetical protein